MIVQLAHYLHTPLGDLEDMLGDDLIAYHGEMLELLRLQNPTK